MNNKIKALIATGILVVGISSGIFILNDKEIDLDLTPVHIEGYCVGGEQILFNTIPESVDEMHCFTKQGYVRLQKEVLERYRNDDHSNDGLLYAMLLKELADNKDNVQTSILLSGFIEDGSLELLIQELKNR